MTDFEQIRKAVNIIDLARFYGLDILHKDKAICCFHNEKTASLKFYRDTNTFYCFGCGAGGSIIDFVSRKFNLEVLEAASKIDVDFSLGIMKECSKAEKKALLAQRHIETIEKERFQKWRNDYRRYLFDRRSLLKEIINSSMPTEDDPEITYIYAYAVHQWELCLYKCDTLAFGSESDIQAFYNSILKGAIQYGNQSV